MAKEYWLTTTDNPYDPFTDNQSWQAYDEQSGYFTNGLLARLAITSPDLSDDENEKAIENAVNDIINLFPGLYKVVYKT